MPFTVVLAKCGTATTLFSLQNLPQALMWGINLITGMLKPEDLAASPILGEKQETTNDLSGSSRGSRSISNFPIIESKYSIVSIFVEG